MTEKTLDWLNENRYRAYPFVNDEGLVSGEGRVPNCILLDCLVVDTTPGTERNDLVFTGLEVTDESSTISLSYGERTFSYTFSGGDASGEGSVFVVKTQSDSPYLHFRLVLSSHAYILEHVGTGSWRFSGRVMPTKIVSSAASGVSGISVHGSEGTGEDKGLRGTLTGDVELRDGYRTMPTIQNGRIVVNVGTKYGKDPCHHDWGRRPVSEECGNRLLFFCGQTGNSAGDVSLSGGPGVSVTQGRLYVHTHEPIIDTYGEIGIDTGEEIPCIEVTATDALMKIYTPTVVDSSDSSE